MGACRPASHLQSGLFTNLLHDEICHVVAVLVRNRNRTVLDWVLVVTVAAFLPDLPPAVQQALTDTDTWDGAAGPYVPNRGPGPPRMEHPTHGMRNGWL